MTNPDSSQDGTDLYLKPVVVPGTVVETHDDGSGWVTVEVVDTDGSTVVLFDVPPSSSTGSGSYGGCRSRRTVSYDATR